MHVTSTKTVVHLAGEGIDAAATVTARAFADDPMFTYIFPNAERRLAPLGRFMRAALRYGVLYGEVTTTSDNAGTVLWLTPGQTDITPVRMLRSGMAALPMTIGLPAFRRFLTVVGYGEQVHSATVREPHWYLLNLAVDPSRWRQGIGSALIAPVLARADQNQQSCYLETNNPDNLPFTLDTALKSFTPARYREVARPFGLYSASHACHLIAAQAKWRGFSAYRRVPMPC
ncbi:GNAT family N-acetyltransferase [Candidatus Gracilibacteria bacterium]|nr:GNAT family N-acetyltransferase [Candidatus Gracilibacteria bacterium]